MPSLDDLFDDLPDVTPAGDAFAGIKTTSPLKSPLARKLAKMFPAQGIMGRTAQAVIKSKQGMDPSLAALEAAAPELTAAAEILPAIPQVVPFNIISNMAIQAQETGADPRALLKAAMGALPGGKTLQNARRGGLEAVLEQESLTAPAGLRMPRELLFNAIRAVKPDFKEPEFENPAAQLAADLGLDIVGGLGPAGLEAAFARGASALSSAARQADALQALQTLKNKTSRVDRIKLKGVFKRQPKALPAPPGHGDGFVILSPEEAAAQQANRAKKIVDAAQPKHKLLPAPRDQGEGFKIIPREEAVKKMAERVRAVVAAAQPARKALPPPSNIGPGGSFKIPREVMPPQKPPIQIRKIPRLLAAQPRRLPAPGVGDGFEAYTVEEGRRRIAEVLRKKIQTGTSGPKGFEPPGAAGQLAKRQPVPKGPGAAAADFESSVIRDEKFYSEKIKDLLELKKINQKELANMKRVLEKRNDMGDYFELDDEIKRLEEQLRGINHSLKFSGYNAALEKPAPAAKRTPFDDDDVLAARAEQEAKKSTHLINTPEREELRKQVVEKMYGKGALQKKRRADIVMGLPASGKSSVVVKPVAEKNGSIVIDDDDAKEFLPEFEKGKFAGAVHKESAIIAEEGVLRLAVVNGDNIVLPVLGKNIYKMRGLIKELKEHGYAINLHHVDLPPVKAAGRAVSRFKETGRFVDPDYVINQVGLKPRKNFRILKNEEGVDSYVEYSNDVKRGEGPRLIGRSSNVRRKARAGGLGGRPGAQDAPVNPEAAAGGAESLKPAATEGADFPALISRTSSKEIRILEKEIDEIVRSEAENLRDIGDNIKGGQIIRHEGAPNGYRTSLPDFLKMANGEKPGSMKQYLELAKRNLEAGRGQDQGAYAEVSEALRIARKKSLLGDQRGFARIPGGGNRFEGMNEAEIRAEVNRLVGERVKGVAKGNKERKFITTVSRAPKTHLEVAAGVQGEYKPISNKQTVADAEALIAKDFEGAYKLVLSDDPPTALSNAVAARMIDKLQTSGRIEDAISVVEKTAEKATKQGQAIQALSIYARLSPEGVLQFAQKTFDKARREITGGKARFTPEEFAKLPKQVQKQLNGLQMTPAMVQQFKGLAQKIGQAQTPRQRVVATALLLKAIQRNVPVSIWKKISLAQTMAQLLNFKTAGRNILGNTGFAALENVSDVAAAAFDKAVSLVTGQRAKVMPNLKVQFRGLQRGFREGMEDVRLGINTSPGSTQYALPAPGVFKSKVGQAFEKTLNYELRVPDRMAYTAAYRESLLNQLKAAKAVKPTDEMLEIAHHDGLYRTFQDDNVISTVFTGLKKALNAGGDFGLGDALIKYPKTPANILARGIEYSPAGFITSMLELSKGVLGHGFNQKKFVESAARAFVGTNLIGTGMIMSKLGLITGRKDDSPGIKDLKRRIGLGDYKINVSGLKRFVLSGFDADEARLRKGDTLKTYDWFLPQAIQIAMGANINENEGRPVGVVGSLADAIGSGTRTLAEQPLVSGMQRAFGYGDVVGGISETVKGIPASFVPSLLNQVKLLVDDVRRNPDTDDWMGAAGNLMRMRTPGLSKSLPAKLDPFAEETRYLRDVKTPAGKALAAFVDPANTSRYGMPPETDMIEQLVKYEVSVPQQGKTMRSIELTEGERTAVNKLTGPAAKMFLTALIRSPGYQALDDLKKQKALELGLSQIKGAAEKATAPAIARRVVGKQAA